MIRRLYNLWPDRRLLAQLWLLATAQALLQGLMIGLLVPILDELVRPDPRLSVLAPWLILGGFGAVTYGVLSIVSDPIGYAAAGTLALQLRQQLIRHISGLPLGWFTAANKSRLARGVTADIGDAAHLAVVIGKPVITSSVLPATIVLIVLLVDWRVALLLIAVALLSLLALRNAARVATEAEIKLERAAADVASRAVELGQAQSVLRAAGHTSGTPRMRTALKEHRRTYRSGMDKARRPFFLYTAVVGTGFVLVLALISILMTREELTASAGVALLILSARFMQPLGYLVDLVGALRAMANKISRVENFFDTPSLPLPENPVDAFNEPSIEFSNVTFTYPGSDTAALSDVSFRCTAGTTTALVGASGSGKTTVTRLIARFFDVTSGSISIGNVDIRDLDPKTLLNDIAIIFQDVYLFDDTIENNLRIACPEATRQELAEAATQSRLDDVIARLPEGWGARVGEAGALLSGGERQRVAIARAILKQSRIVLVDEASSALDPENERAVGAAIERLASDPRRTIIVIAHSPVTLAAADHVISLDKGRVVENGSPAELLAAGGVFACMARQTEAAQQWRINRMLDHEK